MKLGPPAPPAEKPPAALAADKVPTAAADKPALDKPAAEKAATPVEKAAAPMRGVPPERRRALEDSVVTSAPKLPVDPAAKAPARPAGAKGLGKTAAAKAAAAAGEKPAAADKPATPDKGGGAADKPATADKPAPSPLETTAASVPAALRPRRDHSKSPGFYSSVSPAHGATAVSAGPFASSQQKKATVVGIAPPPAEPGKPAALARGEGAAGADVPPLEGPALESPADASTAAGLEPVPGASAEGGALAAEDGGAPPQPVSSPPSVSPVAREEKEETSPGLGYTRSRHDPAMQLVSSSDLELLLGFALDLALGCASDAWFGPLRAALGRLLAGDAAIRNPALEKALTTLANDLEQPGALDEENRQRLYGHVVAVDLALSKRIDVTGQKAIRERLIVDQLLDELGQSHPMISRRLKEQGPLSLENLGRLSPEDLSAKLEAPADTAAQVAGIFQGYLEARVRRGPSVALVGKSVALRERLSALEASAEAFERASEGDDSGARRLTRKQRQTDVAQLNLLLAELGEVKTLAEIERCSVQAKIERLQRWIVEQEVSPGRQAKPSSPP